MASTQVTYRFSLSEPGAVLLLQCELDLPHHVVHFGVRQGALGAAESQGEGDALRSVGNLSASVLVERPAALEDVPAGLLDGGQQGSGGDVLLDHDRKIALDRRGPRQRRRARSARRGEYGLEIDLHGDQPALEVGPPDHRWMDLPEVAELACIQEHGRAATRM